MEEDVWQNNVVRRQARGPAHLLYCFTPGRHGLSGVPKQKGVFFMSAPSAVQTPSRPKMDTKTMVSIAMLTGHTAAPAAQ